MLLIEHCFANIMFFLKNTYSRKIYFLKFKQRLRHITVEFSFYVHEYANNRTGKMNKRYVLKQNLIIILLCLRFIASVLFDIFRSFSELFRKHVSHSTVTSIVLAI